MAKKSNIKAPAGSLRRGSTGKFFVWILLGLLILGLAGFGANGIGGTISSIGSVGKTDISVRAFQDALQQELAFETRRRGGQAITMQQARSEGIDQRVIQRLAGAAALSEETKNVGLSVGDTEVARQLRGVPAFQNPNGEFDRDRYQFALEQNGTRPTAFEEELRLTTARNLLQQAVTGGLTVSETYAETLYGFLGETRSFRWALLDPSLVADGIPAPSDEELAAFHQKNAARFNTEEIRKITYAWLTPDMIVDSIDTDEEALQKLYEERSDQYNRPARRLVERLGFADLEAAEAARAQIAAGEISFDALVEERGLTLSDVDQGEVSRETLDTAVADAIFALTEPGITAPVQTSLGPVLYRVNALLAATEVSFEDARDELAAEFRADRARRDVASQFNVIDELIVGGATLEEIGDETDMQTETLDFSATNAEGIAGYAEFRRAAAQVTTNDFPEIQELSDGGLFALRLDEIIAPTLPPLDDIRDDVTAAWREDQIAKALSDLGETYQADIAAGATMETLGLEAKSEQDIGRSDFIEDAPIGLVSRVFELDENATTVFQGRNGVSALVEVINISPPDTSTEQAQLILSQLNASATEGMALDVFQAFGTAVQSKHGLSLDQAAVNAVLAQFGGGGHGGM